MIIAHNPDKKSQMEYSEDIPYDLSYEDIDVFARSCGVTLPDCDSGSGGVYRLL